MEISGQQTVNSPSFPVFCYKELLEKMEETDDSGVIYPERDGKPIGETEWHVMATFHLYESLRFFFRNQPDIYTIASMLMFYEKGNPKAFKVPDVMVVKGVHKHIRRNFKLWEEKTVPAAIFEITSKSTVEEDIVKTGLYVNLGVKEYFLFDPLYEYLEEGFIGFRLNGLMFTPLTPEKDGSLFSEELGLILKREEDMLRLADPETGRLIPNVDEAVSMAEEESRRAGQAELRAEEAEQRAEEAVQRAEESEQRAEEAAQRAEEEAQKAARLMAKLREMGIDPEPV